MLKYVIIFLFLISNIHFGIGQVIDVKMFPNPFVNETTVSFESPIMLFGNYNIKVFNVVGQKLIYYNQPFYFGNNSHTINVESLIAGVYLFSFEFPNDTITIKGAKRMPNSIGFVNEPKQKLCFPNPVKNRLSLTNLLPYTGQTVWIYNVNGCVVYSVFLNGVDQLDINVSNVNNGALIVVIKDLNGNINYKQKLLKL